jgi:hypothetical protein
MQNNILDLYIKYEKYKYELYYTKETIIYTNGRLKCIIFNGTIQPNYSTELFKAWK